MSTDTMYDTITGRREAAPAPQAHLAGVSPATGVTAEENFEEGLVSHLPVLRRVALRLTRRDHDAEDLVQETVARALAHRTQYQPGTNLRAWLLTVERSIFLNTHRQKRRAPQFQSMDEVDEHALHRAGGAGASPSAEHVLLHGRMADELVAALRALPEHYRMAVVLSDVHGLTYAEVAQQMGCALGTVMSRLHRGRALLRQALAGCSAETGLQVAASGCAVQPALAAA